MRRRGKLSYKRHGHNPITHDGIYKLKWTCAEGHINRLITPVIVTDGEAGYPCNCDEYESEHLRFIPDNYFYKEVKESG